MTIFSGRILITGFGIVAQALLPLLLKHLRVPAHRITVVEFAERPQLRPWRKKGVRLVRERVTPSNLARLLGAHAEMMSCGSIARDFRSGTKRPTVHVGAATASRSQASTSFASASPSPTFVKLSDATCRP